MSADRMSQCPRCSLALRKKADNLEAKAAEAYGNVSQQEYRHLLSAAEKAERAPNDRTLEENCEYRMNLDGEYRLNYYGQCRVCGFKFNVEHTGHEEIGR